MRLVGLFVFAVGVLLCSVRCDDSPGFFLKISKNVPRLGRRSDSYFMKNAKTIPRIGRSEVDRDDVVMSYSLQSFYNWLNDYKPSSPSKRKYVSPASIAAVIDREYSVVQPINANALIELLNQNALPSDSIRFVHWKDFDRALQADGDLFMKVSMLGRKPDERLKEDLSNNLVNVNGQISKSNDRFGQTDYTYYTKGGGKVDKYDRELMGYNYL